MRQEGAAWTFEIMVDPATLGTAQQKRFDPRTRRFFTDRRVAAGMKVVSLLARSATQKTGARLPERGSAVRVALEFLYAVPQSRRRREKETPAEGSPCTAMWAGDCDNRAKAVVDALTLAGFWPDDRFVTKLDVSKRWTLGTPRIVATVAQDGGMAG